MNEYWIRDKLNETIIMVSGLEEAESMVEMLDQDCPDDAPFNFVEVE